ncbi:GNAT family N-acetyltransferase [Oryzifoliimicrobium ureilyticus]|uniref:GNAT family N-acetyltransferase n=1 Tax=Oryzifoliimicrobium ureilyticus TaxID=3113724 RepID=UPI0030760617
MHVELRDAEVADVSVITTIYADAVMNGVSSYELTPPSSAEMKERFLAIKGGSFPYRVAVDDEGEVVGYAYASSFRTRPAYRWTVEDSIYLAPRAQGRGIGKRMLSDLVERCTGLGFRQMIAVIGGASPASVALHHSQGFIYSGVLKATGYKHGRWLDTALMQRALGEADQSRPNPIP